jgi:aspartyl/asparaginyl beta-hydroxylase (cupin superfamily)
MKPWYASEGGAFRGSEPFFFDRKEFPWVAELESQWTVVRDELMALVQEHEQSLVPYANREFTSKRDRWKTFGFMFWSIPSRRNCQQCPKTWDVLSKLPNVLAGSFNLLEPETTIKPHYGDTNAIVRCHLGLVIPAAAPQCAFRVGSETRSWNEGEVLLFCDAHMHTAWNNTRDRRYILLFDVLRDEYAPQKNAICSHVLAGLNLEVAYQRLAWLRRHFNGRRSRVVLHGLLRRFIHLALVTRLPIPALIS